MTRRLASRTVQVPRIPTPLRIADPGSPLCWMGEGLTLVGFGGTAWSARFAGPDRIRQAREAWREVTRSTGTGPEDGAWQPDDAGLPPDAPLPHGPVAFGTFGFGDASGAASVLIAPRNLYVDDGRRSWVVQTRVVEDGADMEDADREGANGEDAAAAIERALTPLGAPLAARLEPGAVTEGLFHEHVAQALDAFADGTVDKLVLARDLVAEHVAGDPRASLARLANRNVESWTFCVDGMLGSSPETLTARHGDTARVRVLAGTAPRGELAEHDQHYEMQLAGSDKDLREHTVAVASAREPLEALGLPVEAEGPFQLRLPTVRHLATDLTVRASGVDALALVDALHPTAAVAGWPRDAATALLAQVERVDRGRYAAPVGWVDAAGDGQWAIALRSAQLSGPDGDRDLVAFAGCGIVPGSDATAEYQETELKFGTIRGALIDPA